MRSVPQVMKGAYLATMRISMEEVFRSKRVHDVEAEVRAWKLFLLFPRMLLFRPARGGKVSKGHLMERLDLFSSGQWAQLIARSTHKKLRPSAHGEDVGRLVQIWNVGLQGLNNWRHWENCQPTGRFWRAPQSHQAT